MTLLRTVGVGTLLYAAMIFGIVGLSRQGARIREEELRPALIPGLFFLAVGLGLCFHHRWAAVLFCVFGFGLGGWFVTSIWTVPFPWVLINLCFGGSLLYLSVAEAKRVRRSR